MDIIPISTKVLGKIGEGITHTITGVYVMLTFLEAEGIKMDCSNDDVIDLGLSVASGKMKYADVLDWIIKFKK